MLTCGCTSKSSPGTQPTADAGIIGSSSDAGPGDAPAGDAPTLSTALRFAHLSPDLPAIDVCYMAPSAQTVTGPVLFPSASPVDASTPPDADVLDAQTVSDAGAGDASASEAAAGDASTSGLSYLGVTSYLTIPTAGTFQILVVPAGGGSCNGALFQAPVTLDTGKEYTLALFGRTQQDAGSSDALALVALTDNPASVAGATRTRFFHAALGVGTTPAAGPLSVSAIGALTLGLGTVSPGQTTTPSATPPTVDVLGYHTDVPLAPPAAFRLEGVDDASGSVWSSAVSDFGLTAASVHTGFIASGEGGGFTLLWCNDTTYGEAMASCVACSADACTAHP
jgi:hypothetical protein